MARSAAVGPDEDLTVATAKFLAWNPQVSVTIRGGSKETSFVGSGSRYQLPALAPGPKVVSMERCQTSFQLHAFGPPKAIASRVRPSGFDLLRDTLLGLPRSPDGTGKKFVVPYYSPSDPMVPILVRRKGVGNSLLLLVHDYDYGGWKVGGHLDSSDNAPRVRELANLINLARMATIVE